MFLRFIYLYSMCVILTFIHMCVHWRCCLMFTEVKRVCQIPWTLATLCWKLLHLHHYRELNSYSMQKWKVFLKYKSSFQPQVQFLILVCFSTVVYSNYWMGKHLIHTIKHHKEFLKMSKNKLVLQELFKT